MKKPSCCLFVGLLFSMSSFAQVVAGRMNEVFLKTDLVNAAANFQDPWEVTYGPDDSLWVTEAKGYKVNKVHPVNGNWRTILDLSDGSSFSPSAYKRSFSSGMNPWPQGGMMGLAVHPEYMTNTAKKFVYLAYVHNYVGNNVNYRGETVNGRLFITWIVRFTYDPLDGKLGDPVTICDTIRGSNDHNSGRLIIKPEGGTNYLYYAVGDMGAGQFDNLSRVNKSQNPSSYEGKILRFNLEEDTDPVQEPATINYNRWIPNDNPYNLSLGVQSAVWSIGMRNNQGFAYDTINGTPRFYGTSHGPFSDDEVNLLEGGKNYGHPLVIGYKNDGNYNNSKAGPIGSSLPLITNELANATTIGASYMDPIYTNYPTPAGNTSTPWTIRYIYTNQDYTYWDGSSNVTVSAQSANNFWSSEAYSGLGIYTHPNVPGWKNSLLVESLKWGRVLRMKLNAAGTGIVPVDGGDTVSYFGSRNRFRDIAVNPDGRSFYVVMDRSPSSSGPSANNPIVPSCAGCVQRYTFLGYKNNASNKSDIPDAIDITPGLAGSCTLGTAVVISSGNSNTNLWVPITGPDGNIIAEIYPNGNDLGTITSSVYIHSGAIRVSGGKKYLNRNITITPENQPAAGQPVRIRLYISKTEFDLLDADGASGIGGLTDLRILKNQDPCSSSILSTTSVITPTSWDAHGADGYVLQATITGFSSFYFGADPIVLPLQLLSFTAELQEQDAIIRWKTAHEMNTGVFQVERSVDGRNYTAIGNITASGHGEAEKNYSFADPNVLELAVDRVYYRLKMIDRDGTLSYSKTESLDLSAITGDLRFSPNPVNEKAVLFINAALAGKASWRLYDNAGRIVLQGDAGLTRGYNSITITTTRLLPGIYYLHVVAPGMNRRVKVQKI